MLVGQALLYNKYFWGSSIVVWGKVKKRTDLKNKKINKKNPNQQPLLLISEGNLGILLLESHQDTWLVHTPSGCKNKLSDFYGQTIQPILFNSVWDFELREVRAVICLFMMGNMKHLFLWRQRCKSPHQGAALQKKKMLQLC